MKILAPLGSAQEVEMLAENGAEEFYCGITPLEWMEKYSAGVWINRRNPFAGVLSFQELRRIVEVSHRYGIPVYITLNAPYYVEEQYPMLLDLVTHCAESIGVDAFIVSDIGFMMAIKHHVPRANLHVSSLAAPLNVGSIELYRELGASRIVLPRTVQVDEVLRLKQAAGEIELEMFILNDGCVYEESFCHTTHNRVGAFCSQSQWEYIGIPTDGDRILEPAEVEMLTRQVQDYREFVWFVNDCGCQLAEDGLPLGPCGLCALPALYRAGVDSLKIVGREGSPYRKLASVQLVKAVVDRVRAQEEAEDVQRFAKKVRNQPSFCESGLMCYYR
ncbi:peptidase U32 family protein [Aneurinibacillus thermoaerophilus]|uniref:U32 family peptidase n=1 Tax=Aneurinibacillus thermoaerophilus TaxID=143495 RepID=A0ABX8Y6W4_ANETH|nr:U32 family peptidase [Aneurinibacillus thermoaerophilus]QYY41271.1 U32 family peptidase [Aneurinibacillus thermoaerophilus]